MVRCRARQPPWQTNGARRSPQTRSFPRCRDSALVQLSEQPRRILLIQVRHPPVIFAMHQIRRRGPKCQHNKKKFGGSPPFVISSAYGMASPSRRNLEPATMVQVTADFMAARMVLAVDRWAIPALPKGARLVLEPAQYPRWGIV